jgi:phage terminase large subunit-like protein
VPARVRTLEPVPAGDPLDVLADLIAAMSPDALAEFVSTLDEADVALIETVIARLPHARWEPMAHQVPPPLEDPWELWLLMAGRGTGKTDACSHEMDKHAKGPPCVPGIPGGHRMAIVAPTLGDASDACVNGPSGLLAHNPSVVERTAKGGTNVIWPNGARARLFGAYTRQDVERLRAGGNRCFVWCEELAAWRYLRACWNHMYLGLRLGSSPRIIASTTPKNRAHLVKLIEKATTRISRAHTRDNPHLSPEVRQRYLDTYEGTRLGRQELAGELLGDVEGALWTDDMIEADRFEDGVEALPRLRRIVVAVDPSWGTTHDECGIVVAAKGWDGLAYVLADYSIRGGPAAWANAAASAYWTWKADALLAEQNFQGEQVKLAMRTIDHPEGRPPVKFVNASRGKQLRAEPVVLIYEQHKVRHVGREHLAGLEWQMTNWVPGAPADDDDEEPGLVEHVEHEGDQDEATMPSEFSPDRVDALVFALTDLMLGSEGPATLTAPTGRIPSASSRRRG